MFLDYRKLLQQMQQYYVLARINFPYWCIFELIFVGFFVVSHHPIYAISVIWWAMVIWMLWFDFLKYLFPLGWVVLVFFSIGYQQKNWIIYSIGCLYCFHICWKYLFPSKGITLEYSQIRGVDIDNLLNRYSYIRVKQVYTPMQITDFLAGAESQLLEYAASNPSYLGNFDFATFARDQIPDMFENHLQILASSFPNRDFNTIWIQRYRVGSAVVPHVDPANVMQVVSIAIFGDFIGGVYDILGDQFLVDSGDVVYLRGMVLFDVKLLSNMIAYY
eukprot:TRINITY_DN3232_c0_g1_i1.p1 TRINITY_DN3232_c0_g1~~TRINITY_DN3232_c0_g1_i1.p1  ORF type:complete len:275 (+),score=26.43 TRINITY_DN3232_c0_g1_i1:129-953(+)